MSERFDFVVVGGGSAGCIVASRLAASGASVLLLESGQAAEDNPETLRADGYKDAFINDRLMHDRFTVAQASCGDRALFAGTGRGMGGSGAINAMVYTRGAREDLDAWGPGWRWDDVQQDFAALESELHIRRREPTAFTEACIRAAEEQGIRRKADLNDGDLRGVLGYEWMNFDGADRRSSYVAFIQGRSAPSLTIRTLADVTSIGFDGERRARSVNYTLGGERKTALATREVVLCAGALASPAILLASGIGPAAELRSIGIDVVLDLPGVGRNLHDHPNATLFFLGKRPVDCHYPQLYGFQRMAPGSGPSDTCFVFYPARSSFKEGLMRMLPAMVLPERTYRQGSAVRWIRRGVGAAFRPRAVTGFVERMWGIVVILGKPKSRGFVRLASAARGFATSVDPQYLSHPDDLRTMLEGIAHARRIAGSAPLAELGSRELIPGPLAKGEEGARRFLANNLMTTYHFAGTCKLGDDERAVVDRRLRVRGVSGLRVIDASVIPETPVSAMNAPSMLVGFRGAKMLLEDGRSGAA